MLARDTVTHDEAAAHVRTLYTVLGNGKFVLPQSLRDSVASSNVAGGWCSQSDCLRTIAGVHRRTGVVIDPHTAVALAVAEQHRHSARPMLVCSTAHWAKFPQTVLSALSSSPSVRDASQSHPDEALPGLLEQLGNAAKPSVVPQSIVDLLSKPVNHRRTATVDALPRILEDYFSRRHAA